MIGPISFGASGIDRHSRMRLSAEALAIAYEAPGTRVVPVWQSRCLLPSPGELPGCEPEMLVPAGVTAPDAIFLGERHGRWLFAAALPEDALPPALEPHAFLGLRELVSQVSERDAALLAYARAMVLWHGRHRYCSACGAPSRPTQGGFVLACTNPACGQRTFPRLDPAIIVLVHRGDRCLLGRQARWPEGRFSTIAGFVEPGETLEDAVAREVREETNVVIGECAYAGSQPWPFPSALMLGFHASALTNDIRLNDGELAEARWLTRAELAGGAVTLPPDSSVAYRLIEAWHDAVPGPGLASFGRDSALFRQPGQPPDFR